MSSTVVTQTSRAVNGIVNQNWAHTVWLTSQSSSKRPMNSKSGAILPMQSAMPEKRAGHRSFNGRTSA